MLLKIVALSLVAAMVASAARAQTAEQKMVAQIDGTFICPEALPSDEARNDALKLFLEQVAAAKPSITVAEITQFRVAMLRKHQCNETLANLGVSPVAKPAAAPSFNNTDHWERAAYIPGAHGMVITVDMDSMISAGLGKMRTWIKYRYNGVGPKNIKESLVYEQLDCARNYHSTISLYSYAPDGHIVSSDAGKPEDEEPIIPESMLAGILPFTCAAHGLGTGR
jgi:hypothetical protein